MKSQLIRELARRNLIRELALQTNRSTEDVRAVYEEQLELLGAEARVKTYLEIIAGRSARDILCKHPVQQ